MLWYFWGKVPGLRCPLPNLGAALAQPGGRDGGLRWLSPVCKVAAGDTDQPRWCSHTGRGFGAGC